MIQTAMRSTFALSLLVLAAPVLADARSRLVSNLEASRKQVIVAYGTSLTAAGAWVQELDGILKQRYPGLATVVNSGGSGMWSEWGVQNLDTRVIQKKPDTVFLEFGINDSVERFHCSVAQSRTNLETTIERTLQSNPQCEIILMTTTPGDQYPPGHTSHRKDIAAYYEMYRAVAKKRGLLLVDHYAHWKALRAKDEALYRKYVPDSVHPTPAGCSAVVTPAILDTLGLQAGAKEKRPPVAALGVAP
jgi:acyl-CoA thioesterase I